MGLARLSHNARAVPPSLFPPLRDPFHNLICADAGNFLGLSQAVDCRPFIWMRYQPVHQGLIDTRLPSGPLYLESSDDITIQAKLNCDLGNALRGASALNQYAPTILVRFRKPGFAQG